MTFHAVPSAHSQLTNVVSISKSAQLYQYQDNDLAQKTPLFLIHGIGGKESNDYRWKRFLNYAKNHPKFQERFKIYLFKYDSSQSVPKISEAIRQTLRTYITENNYPQFRVLAFSEGGLVYRNVMQDPVIFKHTEKIITVASPFHGSPLANQKWLGQQMKENTPFSLMRLTQKLSLSIAKKKHPNFERDFKWKDLSREKAQSNEFALENHKNFIAYGSYFGVNDEHNQALFQSLEIKEKSPKEASRFKNCFNKHAVFKVVQQNLTAIPTQIKRRLASKIIPKHFKKRHKKNHEAVVMLALEEESFNKNYNPMLVYNDGISPISSSLWLGRYLTEKSSKKRKIWKALKSLKGKQKARLFHSIDHANWMEGDNLSEESKLPDLLNPDEAPKTIFEWFIYDICS